MSKAVSEKKETLPANAGLKALFDAQMEGTDSDSFAIPFVKILQSLSPQCTVGKGEYDKDARPGEIFNTVSKKRSAEITIIPVRFKREFLEWKPNRGGLVGRHPAAAPVVLGANIDEKGNKFLDNGNKLTDTRQHYVLIVEEDKFSPAIMPMTSTQIKKSRNLMALVQDAQKAGKLQAFTLSSVPENNNSGSWFGWRIIPGADYASDEAAVAEATAFATALSENRVTIDETQFADVAQNATGSATADDGGDDIPF